MQGVVKAFDPSTRTGSIVSEPALDEVELAPGALDGSVLRFLRQGQRVNFDLDEDGYATSLRLGSEGDMQTVTERPPDV